MGTAPESPARHRRRPFRRFLHVMLDVRQRWWLALWFWLPVGGVVVVASHEAQHVLDPASLMHFGMSMTRWLAVAGIALSLLHWLLSGMQVGAYKRMRRRHESGHCPHCNYNIAAHPDAVCPECGCDHRARRREAIEQLRRAKQWPVQRPITPEA
ncbi:MAG: hypothetical protein ACF8R9_00085 [Phycisphaerales bacterium JB054]